MLQLDMDMEADLGIDSIKRVEILGALQELYPDFPKPNMEELGELRTIGQVAAYLQSRILQSPSPKVQISIVNELEMKNTTQSSIGAARGIPHPPFPNPDSQFPIPHSPIPLPHSLILIPSQNLSTQLAKFSPSAPN